MNDVEFKSDRRERKLNARRKMRVVGKSVKLILAIVRKRALGIKNKNRHR